MSIVSQSNQTLNLTGALIAVLLVLILGAGIAALLKLDLPPNNHDVLLVLITTVANNVTNVIQFFYGSTANAKAKDDANAALASTVQTQANQNAPAKPDVILPPGGALNVAAENPEPTP